MGEASVWLGAVDLLFHTEGFTDVRRVSAAGGQDQEAFPGGGGTIRARTSQDATRIALARRLGAETTVELRTAAGEVLIAERPAPGVTEGVPWVEPHPSEDAVLLAGESGDLVGVAELRGDGGLPYLSDRATVGATYATGPHLVVALERDAETGTLRAVAYGSDGAGRSEVVGVGARLRGTLLGWAVAEEERPLADADRDGLADESDSCPDTASGRRFARLATPFACEIGCESSRPSLVSTGDAFGLGARSQLFRLDGLGAVVRSGSVPIDDNQGSSLAWDGGLFATCSRRTPRRRSPARGRGARAAPGERASTGRRGPGWRSGSGSSCAPTRAGSPAARAG